jgi:chemotaxis protein methyltransferase CheR
MASRERLLADILGYVHERLGFRLSAANRDKLEAKLAASKLLPKWPSLEAFGRDLLGGDPEAREALIQAMTVNHTFFFREPLQLEALVAAVKRSGPAAPAIWSAASSVGAEAYSIAIVLLEAGLQAFRIVASDVNPRVLHAMNLGVYHENRLEGISNYIRLKYFKRVDELHWRIAPELRTYVAIKRINLTETARFRRPFDFIFCRNVFIYFDAEARLAVLDTLAKNLKPGGQLFLGLTEGLLVPPPGLVRSGQSSYRRVADRRAG